MQKISVTNDIEFAYHDSGPPPSQSTYNTVIVIHGHTYHSGTFKGLLDRAHEHGLRVILPNRRLYPESTTYTEAEVAAFQADKTVEQLTTAFLKQGEYLLLFVSKVIAKLDLKSVILVGWSQGTGFLNATVASISAIPADEHAVLRKAVKSIVWWDPPATIHGLPDPPTGGWIPLYDQSLTYQERGQAFAYWLAQYYPHKDLDKKDCNGLVYKVTEPVKPATFTGMPFEELLTKVDLTAGSRGDDPIADSWFRPVVGIARERALFSKDVRTAWGDIPFAVIYGDESPYNVQWAMWKFEEEAEKTGLPIKTIKMPGANHFAMVDHTDLSLDTLKQCI